MIGCSFGIIKATSLASEILGYRSYEAILNQSGTNAPVATVLKNELSGNIIWGYDAIGSYNGLLVGEFTANKTAYWTNQNYSNFGNENTYIYWGDVDTIYVETIDNKTWANGILVNTTVIIRVYN